MQKPDLVKKPTAAIVGRVNVGKSTLFNRIIEESRAIVSGIPGTTRSPNYANAIWRGRIFGLIDTGGLAKTAHDEFSKEVSKYAERAAREADVIVLVLDVRAGLLPEDREIAKRIAAVGKPMILAGNKADSGDALAEAGKIHPGSIGFDELLPVSAVTGSGVGDLLDRAFAEFEKLGLSPPLVEEEKGIVSAVILGKPNTGKSSLLNALVGIPRAVVSEIAHTTREPQDTLIRIENDMYLLVDTAGVRKKMKHKKSLEADGIRRTLAVLKRADVALLILDAAEGIGLQDQHLAGLIEKTPAGAVLVVNKWDLIKDKTAKTSAAAEAEVKSKLHSLSWAPAVFVSAKTGRNVQKIFEMIKKCEEARHRRIDDKTLDSFMRKLLARHPSRGKGDFPYLYAIKQLDAAPPTFMVYMHGRLETAHPSFLNFIKNRLREQFDFEGTPIVVKAKTTKPK